MTKRIRRAIFLVALAVLLACLTIVMGVLYEYFTGVQKNALRQQAALAAQGVQLDGMAYFDGLEANAVRLTWVAADGTVRYDTQAAASQMENHAAREEIAEAMKNGFGEAERTSATLAEKSLYYALRLSDGSVVRASVTQYTAMTLLLGVLQPVLVVLVLAIILSAVLAGQVSKRIIVPLNAIDLDQPLENDVYEELSPLLTRIEQQHRQITANRQQLERQRDEFDAVTGGMNEGLVLLSESGTVLSINAAARRIFHAAPDCVGDDVLTVCRSLPMQKLVKDALAGQHGELQLERNGAVYQLDASPVMSSEHVAGACILAFDVTERMRAEQRRREFSANVSHELKTPLHAIMASAELIENELAAPRDVPRFAAGIRAEGAHLVELVNDIIRLSQLDEGVELPLEDVELKELAQEAVRAVRDAAQEKNVTLQLDCDDVQLCTARRLVYEILYNLCDNAVKYNVPGGRVDVTVKKAPGAAVLRVADTGVGIPVDAQERVFERFYRVDRSHSRSTGGTGLGLSIVKHAAQQLQASVELESEPGKGTTVTVRLPMTE
ncbi:MAG: ATP-binding protein [Clostridiales bacterium]|nr:ATP-binding protein [Clostridiales bacterium]